MMERSVTAIYFSPSGNSATLAKKIGHSLQDAIETIDLLRQKKFEGKIFSPSDIAVVTMPVFSGRIPALCVDKLKKLQGNRAKAIATVLYGNRAYDDALLELSNLLQEQGFILAGAGAFVARHTIFPALAQGRPDSADLALADSFAKQCLLAIESSSLEALPIPGNQPYRELRKLPLSPSGNGKCNRCGTCAKLCPVSAIPEDHPRKTDARLCINCTACIYNCPQKARFYHGLKYRFATRRMLKNCATRKEAELFINSKA